MTTKPLVLTVRDENGVIVVWIPFNSIELIDRQSRWGKGLRVVYGGDGELAEFHAAPEHVKAFLEQLAEAVTIL